MVAIYVLYVEGYYLGAINVPLPLLVTAVCLDTISMGVVVNYVPPLSMPVSPARTILYVSLAKVVIS